MSNPANEWRDVPGPEGAAVPWTIWPPSQFLKYVEPPGNHLLLPKYFSKGTILSLLGPPGVGKSRLALWLAVCQILGDPWCGIPTAGDPQRWLMLGDENSVGRLKHDLEKMLHALDDATRQQIDDHLRIQAILTPEDGDLDLSDPAVAHRAIATMQSWPPGVVSYDPLGSCYGGDLAKPEGMKAAVRLLERVTWTAAPGAGILAVHHARTGKQNLLQVLGFDAGNFGLGGKSLLARSRCSINLGEENEDGNGAVVVACAKANDCQKFDPRCVDLHTETMSYRRRVGWDVEAWRARVEGKRRSGGGLCTLSDVVDAVRDGYTKTKDLIGHLTDAFATSNKTIERLLTAAVAGKYLIRLVRGTFALGPNHNKLREND